MSDDDSRNRAIQAEIAAASMMTAYKGLRKILLVLIRRAPNQRLEITAVEWANLTGTEEVQVVNNPQDRTMFLTEKK